MALISFGAEIPWGCLRHTKAQNNYPFALIWSRSRSAILSLSSVIAQVDPYPLRHPGVDFSLHRLFAFVGAPSLYRPLPIRDHELPLLEQLFFQSLELPFQRQRIEEWAFV